ncbi:hypothetical protein BH20ACT19_BH20ACT19_12340 [soil metagenome]
MPEGEKVCLMARAPTRTRRVRTRSGSGVRWDRVGRLALLVTLGVILLLYISPAKHWIEQSRTAKAQDAELRDLTDENRRLRARAKQLRDPTALEEQARRLGMVRQGERSFVIENPPQ